MWQPNHSKLRLCSLELACGHNEACPGERCAFWDEDGAVLEGRRAFEWLDVSERPEFAAWLLGVRRALESASIQERADEARSEFFRRLNAGRE